MCKNIPLHTEVLIFFKDSNYNNIIITDLF